MSYGVEDVCWEEEGVKIVVFVSWGWGLGGFENLGRGVWI